ncbi:MAG TPA: DUF4139 domain-containing protein [Armatimonadota bacterium]|nr:DUF4139 domain-containing protein [Armatimonadota bacterium]
MKHLVLALALLAWVAAPKVAGAAEATLPVSKVTVFSSGVAYFEHNGRVTDTAEVTMRFKMEGINDLLKSLVVMDLGGGSVSSVNYASREPLERALKGFGVDLTGQPTLPDLLRQLRGASVTVRTPELVTGKILAVRSQKKQIVPGNALVEEQFLELVTDEGLKAIPLDSIRSISLADARLNEELQKALLLLAENRDVETRPVMLRFSGKGEREVRVGYVAEAPVWKSSYRLVLDEAKGGALLQGWAVVENTSDLDWEGVTLTLASGRPISFIQDLYTPLYVPRPVVQSERYASLRPQEYAEGMETLKAPASSKAMQRREASGKPPAVMAPAPASTAIAADAGAANGAMRSDLQPAATGETAGELFVYQMKEPVTIPRRQSAMLPIINQKVQARKVSIYNQRALANHPLSGVWLTNNTDLTLLAGPVTLLDGGTYAGDALLGNITPKERRLLSYAVDLKTTVDSSVKSSKKIASARIVRGTMTITHKRYFTQTYSLKNKADEERVVIIEHPFNPERTLIEPKEPTEKTPELYRFEVTVPAGATRAFDVREEQTEMEMMDLLPADLGTLQMYASSDEIPRKTREALAEAVRRRQALAQAEREVTDLTKQIADLRRDQAETRSNMGAVTRNSQAYERFEKKLLEIETRIEALQKELDAKRDAVKKLRQELDDYLAGLNVE